jgi:opine dehydrogenase
VLREAMGDMAEKIIVMEDGAFSLSIAVDLIRNGADLALLRPEAGGETRTITLAGAFAGKIEIPQTSDLPTAVAGADLIIINATPERCEEQIGAIAPYLRAGQRLVLFPSIFLALVAKMSLERRGIRGVAVCEIVSSPAVCDMAAPEILRIYKHKKELKLSASSGDEAVTVAETLNRYLPIFVPAKSFIETSLENINAVLHPLPILLNLAEVGRKGEEFRHFIDGIDPLVSSVLERLDRERIRIGEALELRLTPTLDHLKNYYGDNDRGTIYDYIHSPECPYGEIRGFGIGSRYIVQDIPYLLVPASCLARAAGVEAGLIDACIDLGSAVSGRDFRKEGLDLERMGFGGMGIDEIVRAAAP